MDITDRELWATAITTYGIGDIATTASGLEVEEVKESHPISKLVIDDYGIAGMVAVKSITMLAFYKLYQNVSEEYRQGIPIGLTILGSGIMLSNSVTVATAIGR